MIRFELVIIWSIRLRNHVKESIQFNSFKLLDEILRYNLYKFIIYTYNYYCIHKSDQLQNIKEISSRVTILGFREIIFKKMLANYCQFSLFVLCIYN